MTPKQVALVQDSFAKVALTSEAAAELFYDRLFDTLEFTKSRERAPHNRADFERVNITLAEDRWAVDGAARKSATKPPRRWRKGFMLPCLTRSRARACSGRSPQADLRSQ
jgi:hypothetical protein